MSESILIPEAGVIEKILEGNHGQILREIHRQITGGIPGGAASGVP